MRIAATTETRTTATNTSSRSSALMPGMIASTIASAIVPTMSEPKKCQIVLSPKWTPRKTASSGRRRLRGVLVKQLFFKHAVDRVDQGGVRQHGLRARGVDPDFKVGILRMGEGGRVAVELDLHSVAGSVVYLRPELFEDMQHFLEIDIGAHRVSEQGVKGRAVVVVHEKAALSAMNGKEETPTSAQAQSQP